MPKSADRKINRLDDLIEPQSVRLEKRPFEHRLRDFKSYEIVILLRCVTVLLNLAHIKAKLNADVRSRIFGVCNFIAIFLTQLRKRDRDRTIDKWMTRIVRAKMGQRSERKGEFIQIRGF